MLLHGSVSTRLGKLCPDWVFISLLLCVWFECCGVEFVEKLAVVVLLRLVAWWWVRWHGPVRVSVSADLRSVSPLLRVISGWRVWALSVSGEVWWQCA